MNDQCNYNIIAQTYFESIDVVADPRCNGWTAINKGATQAIVNNIKLKPFPPGHPELSGEAFGVQGNKGEIYKGHITIDIDAAGGEVLLVQKYYLNT